MKSCAICGKKSTVSGRHAFLRSHYNPVGKTRKYPNLQWHTLSSGKRIKACVRCKKTSV